MELTPAIVIHGPVLRYFAKHPGATLAAAAEATGKLPSNLKRDLPKLTDLIDADTRILTEGGLEAVAALERAEGAATAPLSGSGPEGYVALLHRQITPDPDQPRKDFESDDAKQALAELAGSIVEDKLLENLVVRPLPIETNYTADGLPMFKIIAGERRWRAIHLAQEDERLPWDYPIACNVRDLDEASVRRVALIENLQRKDLRPLEEANAIAAYMEVSGESTAEIATSLNRTQRFVQRRVQLLKLSDEMKAKLEDQKITLEEAWRWLDNRPKPATLSLRQWLIALEVYDWALTNAPEENYDVDVPCGPEAVDDEDLKPLGATSLYLAIGPESVWEGGVRTSQMKVRVILPYARPALALRFPDADLDDAAERAKLIAEVRAAIDQSARTAWLRDKFELSDEDKAAIAAKQAETSEQDARRTREHTEALKRQAAWLLRARELTGGETAPAPADVVSVANDLGWKFPVALAADGTLSDAAGREIIYSGYSGSAPASVMAARTLIAAAMNAGAGHVTEAFKEGAADDDPPSRAAFLNMVIDCLEEDCEDLGDDPADATAEATRRAEAGLDAFLAEEGIEYGHPDYAWDDEGAMSLAEGIRVDGLGQDAPAAAPADEEEAAA